MKGYQLFSDASLFQLSSHTKMSLSRLFHIAQKMIQASSVCGRQAPLKKVETVSFNLYTFGAKLNQIWLSFRERSSMKGHF